MLVKMVQKEIDRLESELEGLNGRYESHMIVVEKTLKSRNNVVSKLENLKRELEIFKEVSK